VQHDWGTGRFTTPDDRFGGSSSSANLDMNLLSISSVGVFFPRRGCDRASDTPVAFFSGSPSRLTQLPRCCYLAAGSTFGLAMRVGGCEDRQDHR
jgi:hypothetical protein